MNCGFARVAIREYSEVGRGKHFTHSHSKERAQNVQKLFSPLTQYRMQSSMFECEDGRESQFDRSCKKINGRFMKWSNRDKRLAYMKTFSTEVWKQLPKVDRKRHTLRNCTECALAYRQQQESFPGPTYTPSESLAHVARVLVEQNSTTKVPEQTTTRQILSELQPLYQEAYGHNFTESLSNCQGTDIQKKTTDAERKRLKRKIQRDCRDHISGQLQQSDAITVLSETQSLASYKRIRLSQSFETPEQTRDRARTTVIKRRRHSPKFTNVQWDKEGLLDRLQNWPTGQMVNWSELAREFNVPGKNKGQVVKEFAIESGVDVFQLDQRPSGTRLRARKLRMPGGEVSVPTHRTVEGIKEDWDKLIESGELTLGEPCHPQKLTRYTVKDGELQQSETTVYGRKIPLLEVRKRLLQKHESLMHLHSDQEIANLQKSELLDIYRCHNIKLPTDLSEESLRANLKQCERTRTVGIWHDHSSILGRGYILLTAKILYDPAVFRSKTDTTGKINDIQAFIEEPEISILAISSSTIEDQAALIGDRVDCMIELSTEVTTQSGIPITDRLMFFYGDKPAAQFERGTQIGGHYPCGSCGTHIRRMDDFAYCMNCRWRSLQQLQTLATKG